MFGNLNKDTIILGLGAGLTAYSLFFAKGNKVFGVSKKIVQIAGVGLLGYGAYTKFMQNKPVPMPMPLPAPVPAAPGAISPIPVAPGGSMAVPIGGGGGIPAGLPIAPTNGSDVKQSYYGTMNGLNMYNELL